MSFSGTKGWNTKPKPGVMLNPLHPLSRGLVGYWLFNEGSGSLANDISGNGNHGTLTNMVPNVQGSGWGSSKFGSGLRFDGVNDYVNCGDDTLKLSTSGTIVLWINIDTPLSGTWRAGISKWSAGQHNYWLGLNNVNKYIFSFDGVSANDVLSINVATGGWHHLVGVADASTGETKLYLDGVLQGTTSTYDGVAQTGSDNLYIGCSYGTSYLFKSTIDNVYIYNRALSAMEVKQLYQNPFYNLLQVPIRRYSVISPPVGVIMNQFQRANIGADLWNGTIIL